MELVSFNKGSQRFQPGPHDHREETNWGGACRHKGSWASGVWLRPLNHYRSMAPRFRGTLCSQYRTLVVRLAEEVEGRLWYLDPCPASLYSAA